jgi:hypothetical protein
MSSRWVIVSYLQSENQNCHIPSANDQLHGWVLIVKIGNYTFNVNFVNPLKSSLNVTVPAFATTGCGKLASFFHIALSAKKEVSLPHPVHLNGNKSLVFQHGYEKYPIFRCFFVSVMKMRPLTNKVHKSAYS